MTHRSITTIAADEWIDYTFSPALAKLWHVQHDTVLRLFKDRPGVLRAVVVTNGKEKVSLVIPRKVARAVRTRLWAALAPRIDEVGSIV